MIMNDIFEETNKYFAEGYARMHAESLAKRRRAIQIGSLVFGILLIASLFIFRAEISAFLAMVFGYVIGGIFTIALLMLVGMGGAGGALTGFFSSKH